MEGFMSLVSLKDCNMKGCSYSYSSIIHGRSAVNHIRIDCRLVNLHVID